MGNEVSSSSSVDGKTTTSGQRAETNDDGERSMIGNATANKNNFNNSYNDKPIGPVTSNDDRPLIKELLDKNSTKIKEMEQCIQSDPLYNQTTHDSIWMLRFILDHGNIKDAVKAAKTTLKYRKEHNIDDIKIQHPKDREGGLSLPVDQRIFYDYWEKDTFINIIPDSDRGVISYMLLQGLNQHELVKALTEEQILKDYINLHEWAYQISDDITRRTGRLTKQLRIFDMKSMPLRQINRKYLFHIDARINAQMADVYPLLLGALFIVNSPPWIKPIWSILKKILPRRMVANIHFVNPCKRHEDMEDFMRYISRENLPERYGGSCKEWPPLGLSSS